MVTVSTSRAAMAVLVLVVGGLATSDALVACWRPPVSAPVSDPFVAPACRWCPGNRGLEYATRPGQVVRAVASGRVTFSGRVAGTDYVVVELLDGRRVTYGRLLRRHHERGDVVLRGQAVGTADRGFHLGVRVGERYVDPAPLIGRLVGRPRLVPLDGSPAAPAPPVGLRC